MWEPNLNSIDEAVAGSLQDGKIIMKSRVGYDLLEGVHDCALWNGICAVLMAM